MQKKRLRYYLLTVSVFISVMGFAQLYSPVDNGSAIKFSIKNFSLTVTGSFTGLEGTIRFNPTELSASLFNVSIDANTVNTGIAARDNHIRKETYFNVQKYPKISFISKHISAGDKPGTYLLTGTLTMKGVMKEISFFFTTVPVSNGLLFTGECKLNRRDFKVGGSSLVLSDNVVISLSVLARKL